MERPAFRTFKLMDGDKHIGTSLGSFDVDVPWTIERGGKIYQQGQWSGSRGWLVWFELID